jgi:16S rRNA (guanine527-N7)-methyltransferase
VESRNKRAAFLSTVLARISLKKTFVHHGRAEEFMQGRKASLIISRAFMPWKRILDFCGPALDADGQCIFLTNEILVPDDASPWRLTAQSSYEVNGRMRHLCALTKA